MSAAEAATDRSVCLDSIIKYLGVHHATNVVCFSLSLRTQECRCIAAKYETSSNNRIFEFRHYTCGHRRGHPLPDHTKRKERLFVNPSQDVEGMAAAPILVAGACF